MDCKEWTGSRSEKGYGFVRRNGRTQRVHRVVWEEANGPIPEGLHVLHRCDNPPCYELAHLFLGTNQDNVDDRQAKGRNGAGPPVCRGLKHGRAKLSDQQVCEIRASVLSNADLAAMYRVGRRYIAKLKKGVAR